MRGAFSGCGKTSFAKVLLIYIIDTALSQLGLDLDFACVYTMGKTLLLTNMFI